MRADTDGIRFLVAAALFGWHRHDEFGHQRRAGFGCIDDLVEVTAASQSRRKPVE